MDTWEDDFLIKMIRNFISLLVTTDFNDSQVVLSDRQIITNFCLKIFQMHITQKCCISIKSVEKVSAIKKGKQLVSNICSFCFIVAYRLKPVLLFISVGQTSFFLFSYTLKGLT